MPESSDLRDPLLKSDETGEAEELPASKKPVDDLRDFTDEFIERGYHAEYANYRDGYLKWRKGDHKGAKGENDDRTHVRNKKDTFEYWYPTVSSFTFRRSCSYWTTVMYIEGCLLFLWQPLFDKCWPDVSERMLYYMAKLPILCGTTIFGCGIYMGYLELINMDTDTSENRVNLLWCNWLGLLKLLREDREDNEDSEDEHKEEDDHMGNQIPWYVPASSIAGWVAYLLGAVMYQVGNTADMFAMSETTHSLVVEWPLIVGGFCFFVGGICEVAHNRVWANLPNTLVWWTSILNFIGGVDFWLSACPSIVGEYATLVSVKGTVVYLLGAILALCMWRGEQFGLSLISNLNRVHRNSGTQIAVRTDRSTGASQVVPVSAPEKGSLKLMDEVVTPKLSWRGLLFVIMCVLCGTSQLLNLCGVIAAPWEFERGERTTLRHIASECIAGLVSVVGVHMVILLNSVNVRIPKEQPYHLLTKMMRLLLTLLTLQSVMKNEFFLEDEADKGSR
eukprot:TRINITY_DN91004_c0_g1_i1.p1 TRINITY_DN91004_c0_g1~~TRINITY_DN91004_c0_g1_i1.p1  ORF type:complete len:505 (+),score=66.01 TRINITY_DN91004_c0_g1_i1:88-1602(+)